MVKLNNLLTSVSLGLLSLSGESSAYQNLFKRYDNATSCSIATSVSAVNVYGPAYTGPVSNKYTTPTIVGEWLDAPVWSIYIPQDVYNITGLDLILSQLTNAAVNAEDYKLYTGDIGDFIDPGAIYSTTTGGLTFDGKTQAPLLKIVFTPGFDSAASSYFASFNLELDVIPSGPLAKRDLQSFDLSATIEKPGSSSSSSAPATTTTSSSSSSSSSSTTKTSTSSTSTTSSSSSSSSATTSSTSTSSGSPGKTFTDKTTSSQTVTSCSDEHCTKTPGSAVTHYTKITSSETITSCSDEHCTKTTPSAPVTTVTPVPGHTVVVGSTTLLTITSCADNGCTAHTVPCVGTVVSTTVGTVVSTYSTYHPITPVSTTTVTSGVPGTTTTITPGVPGTTTTVPPSGSTIVSTSSTVITSSSISIYVAGANAVRGNALAGGIAGLIAGVVMML